MEKPKDFIYHTTTTQFPLLKRLKVLLGGQLIIDSEIAVDQVVNVLGSKATDRIEPPKIFRWLWKG